MSGCIVPPARLLWLQCSPHNPAGNPCCEVAIDVTRNPPLGAGLRAQLIGLWADVSNAGGAVGFPVGVTPAEVKTLAEPAFARVESGHDDLVVALVDDRPVGMGFLITNELTIHRRWATVKRLQRHPDMRRAGVGGAVLDGLEDAARDRGIERVVLTVRGGTGREGFYGERGYRLEAVLPARIDLGDGDVREELVMGKSLKQRSGSDEQEALKQRSGSDEQEALTGAVLRVHRLDADLPVPRYAHPGDAGLDLHARVDVDLAPGERAVVPTGVAVALPYGCVGLVHPRSGLAARHGMALVNAPGTIDQGYRGEIKVILVNLDPRDPVRLRRGERIAQLVVQRVEAVEVVEVDALDTTGRGAGGFGSSGR